MCPIFFIPSETRRKPHVPKTRLYHLIISRQGCQAKIAGISAKIIILYFNFVSALYIVIIYNAYAEKQGYSPCSPSLPERVRRCSSSNLRSSFVHSFILPVFTETSTQTKTATETPAKVPLFTRDIFDSYIHLFGVRLNPTYTYSEWSLNFTFLFQSVLGSHVYSFGAFLNPTYTHSEWSLNSTFLFQSVLDSHVYSFGAFLNSTNTY